MATQQYFPDIIEGVVARVSAAFEARITDPFAVFFDKGIYGQTARSVQKNKDNFPLVWLRMPVQIIRADWRIYADIRAELHVVMPTKSTYTEEEREELIYKPRLIPVYDAVVYELKRERWFQFAAGERLSHTRFDAPFWKIPGETQTPIPKDGNLFGMDVDEIRLNNLRVKIKRQNCSGAVYSVNKFSY